MPLNISKNPTENILAKIAPVPNNAIFIISGLINNLKKDNIRPQDTEKILKHRSLFQLSMG